MASTNKLIAKPFIKWVGGKTKLIPKLNEIIQSNLGSKVKFYVEPFIGGGALFFWLKSNNIIADAVISDINTDLIITYKVVQNYVDGLIDELEHLQSRYFLLVEAEQEKFFYDLRIEYNSLKPSIIESEVTYIRKAALFIFLNKTCFNGLYRQNSRGEFNVPFGRYKKPVICDSNNLKLCSLALSNVRILCGDFYNIKSFINNKTLVYLDPPYKPISKTSSFTKYHNTDFNDNDQVRLAEFYKQLDEIGATIILSNSDLSSVDANNTFFEELYKDFNIIRVNVARNVGASSSSRKSVSELIIKNIV